MAILEILQYPDLRLRRSGYSVGNVKAVKIQKTIQDIVATLLHQKHCAGLAATQLAIDNPPNITVVKYPAESNKNGTLCLINLEIVASEGVSLEEEACMSIERVYAKVKRAAKVRVKALDIQGNLIEFSATDYFARCLQHEYDHLHGILYLDHLEKKERLTLEKQITDLCSK